MVNDLGSPIFLGVRFFFGLISGGFGAPLWLLLVVQLILELILVLVAGPDSERLLLNLSVSIGGWIIGKNLFSRRNVPRTADQTQIGLL